MYRAESVWQRHLDGAWKYPLVSIAEFADVLKDASFSASLHEAALSAVCPTFRDLRCSEASVGGSGRRARR